MSNLFAKVGGVIASIGLAIGGFFGYVPEPEIAYVPEAVYVPQEEVYAPEEETLGADAVLPVAGVTYYLAGTGISSSATSFTLTSFTITQNGKEITDAEMSETFYFTLEPGSRARQEIVACTTVVQNADDTATISGCSRGMAPVTPYTASTSLQFAHAGGSIAILSNPPQLYNQLAFKDNDLTITGNWQAPVPTNASGIATKGYVDSVVTGGAITLDNVSVGAIAGETFATGTIVYFDSVQQEWMKASATTTASSTATILGIAQGSGSNGIAIHGGVLIKGYDETQRGGTAGQTIYLSNTAGATSTSAGVYSIALGMYKDSTTLYFDPTGLNTFIANSIQTKSVPFGGTGADGDLNITSGTTTLDLSSKTEWNYKSINIGSGAALTFTGGTNASSVPSIKVQGNFNNSGIISTKGLGAPGGSGGAVSTYDGAATGTRTGTYFTDNSRPDAGAKGYGAVTSTGGTGGVASNKNSGYFYPEIALNGSGGGGGGGGTPANVGTPGAGGAGGAGGLGLYIEVAGSYTQSGIINLNGVAGTNGSNCPGNGSNSWSSGCGGGGGGGGAGSLVVLYKNNFTYTGTTTVTGGAGGAAGSKTNTGGGGGSPVMGAGGGGGAGGPTSFESTLPGTPGSSSSETAGPGSAGGNGVFIFKKIR